MMMTTPDRSQQLDATRQAMGVSIVIICYQQGEYLADAIRSAKEQTRPADEIIVVDDGSTDQTREVAGGFPEVGYVWQENAGLSAARNAGMRASKNAHLIFLDADDRLLPNAVETGLACLSANPECAFAYGSFCRIDRAGARTFTHHVAAYQDAYEQLLRINFIAAHSTVIYRKAALEAAGGFDPALEACEDYDVYLRLTRQFPVACHSDVVTEIRHHDSNMSGDPARMLKAAIDVIGSNAREGTGDACRAGRAFWRRHYGPPLLGRIATGIRGGRFDRQLLRRLSVAFRYYPGGLATLAVRGARKAVSAVARRVLPGSMSSRVTSAMGYSAPRRVRFGNLDAAPFSRQFGFDRGLPVDRYYIERFLEESSLLIRGRVLEIGDASYTRQFGGSRVTQSDVLNLRPNAEASYVGDLTDPKTLPAEVFDTAILTQTLHVIYEMRTAMENVHRSLRPGGLLLATLPGISQICGDPDGKWNDSWRLTGYSARRLFESVFGEGNVEVWTCGNVQTSIAFLAGLAASELRPSELDAHDPDYPMIICVRARRQGSSR